MNVVAILLALGLLMFIAYRGYSVIVFAPLCALLAVLLSVDFYFALPYYSGVFMVKMVEFIQRYFPVFLLGAIFGKVVELSGAAASISKAIVKFLGPNHAMFAIVTACAVLTYGGVSLFVVAFAVYPFAASLFREANLPKRLIPGTIALGSFTFTMVCLPGSPQIQNIIPTTFFGTTIYAAPILGGFGAIIILVCGFTYLEWRKRQALALGEGYGTGHVNEPEEGNPDVKLPNPWLAILPLVLVGIANLVVTRSIPHWYGDTFDFATIGMPAFGTLAISKVTGIWSIEIALLLGIAATFAIGYARIVPAVKTGLAHAVSGALLATMNTASEYGFGCVIASLPGFAVVKTTMGKAFSNPLINEAVSVNVIAGITGSASGGLSIALAALGKQYLEAAQAAGISPEVLHRIASMASGGMDTLPHNGAVITLLAITGLTHKQSYKDIFAITLIVTGSVFAVIGFYTLTHLV